MTFKYLRKSGEIFFDVIILPQFPGSTMYLLDPILNIETLCYTVSQ